MARISRYDLDTGVSKGDKVIGTDITGVTKNYSMEDVAHFLNTSSLINVNGQLVYQFTHSSNLTAGKFNIANNQVAAFSAQTSFEFSHLNTNNQNIQTYLNYFEDLFVMLTQTDNQNNFAQYSVDSITASSCGTYSTLAVTFREGNGNLIADKHYAMAFSPKGQTDKNYVTPNYLTFNQANNFTNTVTHNLNKFPSVTVVDSGGSHIVGDVQHINENSFTIKFTSSFSAKVYAN